MQLVLTGGTHQTSIAGAIYYPRKKEPQTFNVPDDKVDYWVERARRHGLTVVSGPAAKTEPAPAEDDTPVRRRSHR